VRTDSFVADLDSTMLLVFTVLDVAVADNTVHQAVLRQKEQNPRRSMLTSCWGLR
jgi:hypothetical protein